MTLPIDSYHDINVGKLYTAPFQLDLYSAGALAHRDGPDDHRMHWCGESIPANEPFVVLEVALYPLPAADPRHHPKLCKVRVLTSSGTTNWVIVYPTEYCSFEEQTNEGEKH